MGRAIAEPGCAQICGVAAKLRVVFHLTREIEAVVPHLLVPGQIAEQHVSRSTGRSRSLKIRSERSVRKFSFAAQQAGRDHFHGMRNHMHHDADWLSIYVGKRDGVATGESGELNRLIAELSVRDLVIEDQHTGYARRSDYAGRQPIHVNARGNARFCRKSMIRIHDQRRQQQPHCFRDNARVATTRHSCYLLAVLAGTVNATCRVST